ncbi:hypothetical protein AOC36_09695 [Erysipelothrix larvae]|uniref:Uncharacterized protein n=1 Tax=Erysipelothrix larvae TaxID=1514105 RepID=A0A109UHJ0_9FIRM|nr:hypothetical protein [Erysipelothrix larvae]AMC94246.1 hypothetical protein AOC36_09695 [Erysipelothrix larvae]
MGKSFEDFIEWLESSGKKAEFDNVLSDSTDSQGNVELTNDLMIGLHSLPLEYVRAYHEWLNK